MADFIKQKKIDSLSLGKIEKKRSLDWPLVNFIRKNKKSSVLFSKWGKTSHYSTNNLHIHFIKSKREANFYSLDGFLKFEKRMPVKYVLKNRIFIYEKFTEKYGNFRNYLQGAIREPLGGIPMVKLWNVSMVAALIFGMFIMTVIYRYLGQDASAVTLQSNPGKTVNSEIIEEGEGKVLGESAEIESRDQKITIEDLVAEIMKNYDEEAVNNEKFQNEIREMVKGYPIEKMIPYIAKQDRIVAAFLVGIARKESGWGVRVPVLDGEDCFNYWGYRGIRERMGTGGHTCFDSPEDAVNTVAKRIKFLVSDGKRDTPQKMIVWKCGYDCSWDNPVAVKKWVSDVDYYFRKFDKMQN